MRDLSQQLIELGPRVSFPDPPDLAGAVLADPRLRQTRPPVRIHRAVAVALVAVLVVVLALPGPRAAIASLLGLGGTQITIVDELPSVALTGVIPGDRVTLGEARSQLGFGLLLPDAEPTELYIERSGPSQILTMAFVGDDGAYGLTITEMSDGGRRRPAGEGGAARREDRAGGTSVATLVTGSKERMSCCSSTGKVCRARSGPGWLETRCCSSVTGSPCGSNLVSTSPEPSKSPPRSTDAKGPPQNKIRGVVWWCGDHRDGVGGVFGDDSAASG